MSGDLNMANPKHRDFIDKLIKDDSFRATYEKDPVKVLKDHNIRFDSANPPQPGQMLDVAALKAARARVIADLDSGGWCFLQPPYIISA